MAKKTRLIKCPDLTRIDKSIGKAREDLGIEETLNGFKKRIKNTYRTRDFYPLENTFLLQFKVEDAIYRRDILEQFLDNEAFQKTMKKISRKLPRYQFALISTDWYDEVREADSQIRLAAINNTKYLYMDEALETILSLPNDTKATQDILAFAEKAKKALKPYFPIAEKLRKKPIIIKKPDPHNSKKLKFEYDYEWNYHCAEKLEPFMGQLKEVIRLKKQFSYYKALAIPFEVTCNGKRIPSCKPKFLPQEERKGELKKAYHPHFFEKTWDYSEIEKLNIPNDVHWGDNARNTYILGANGRGKSVYLKTIGLNTHLAMAGLYAFAKEFSLSPVDQIFPCFDMGDTLGAGHFHNGANQVTYMKENITINSLVLGDEIGGGTEPEAETWVSKGISDALIYNNISSFFITHDKGTWEEHQNKKNVIFLRVSDIDDNKRKYRIWEGIPESGYGKKIAKKAGIDPHSMNEALKKI